MHLLFFLLFWGREHPQLGRGGTILTAGRQIILRYIVPQTSFPRKNCPGDKFSWGTENPPTLYWHIVLLLTNQIAIMTSSHNIGHAFCGSTGLSYASTPYLLHSLAVLPPYSFDHAQQHMITES